MLNTRIYRILITVERKQLNRFNKFVKSPYLNSNKQVMLLAEFAIKSIKANQKLPAKDLIWKDVLSIKEDYNDLKYRKLCNDFLDAFERFLIIEQLELFKLQKANLLLRAIKDSDYKELVEKQISKSSRQLEREVDKSADFYLQKYFFEKSIHSLKTNYEKKADIKKFLEENAHEKLSQNLDIFYVIEKLRHATDILTWRKLYKTSFDLDLGFTQDIIERYSIDQIPAVRIYLLMFYIMKDQDAKKSFDELKSYAKSSINNFPMNEQREIFDVLLSYCIKNVNTGDKEAYKESLELYDWGIKEEIILEKGFITPTTFRNYVVIGLRMEEFNKVERFISEKSLLLEPSRQENAVNFNMARVAFYKKQYDQVLSYLNEVNYEDIWYGLNSRSYLLTTYYEMGEFDALDSQLESFATYLRREKSLGQVKRDLYMNFILILRKIHRNTGKESLLKIKNQLAEIKVINNRAWLNQKIDELF